ncbi:hypothetical protein PPGU19_070770 (plasmid) [Paraburkholderia sp. PGU19]|nr:hypothetical protein PPGU19_070770 [Paraburkholderia sp. PGU19]
MRRGIMVAAYRASSAAPKDWRLYSLDLAGDGPEAQSQKPPDFVGHIEHSDEFQNASSEFFGGALGVNISKAK